MGWMNLREWARSRAVRKLHVLDNAAEPALDRFVEQAAAAFAAPIALLTIFHDQQLMVRASVGLDVPCLPRQDSFCHYAIDRDDLLEVCDAQADALFQTLPCVMGEPHARYYLGAPIKLTRNLDVGMLCVLDTCAREPASLDQRAYLLGLARQATHAIERRAETKGLAA